MRVTLLHNPKAGREEYSGKSLTAALRQNGHEVTYRSTRERKWKAALDRRADLVLVAGGDGTVAKVARQLIGRETPLSVLPLGTANNLARTLGFDLPVKKLLPQIGKGTLHGFDVGLARGPWGRRYLFEGMGGGLLAEYLRLPKMEEEKGRSREEEMHQHVARLGKLLSRYRARKWELQIDDEKLTDRFLLIAALNICSVGPVLNFAPEAKTNDGQFDLVLAREPEREALMDHLAARLAGKKVPDFPLPSRSFKRLRINWKKSPLHLDDELWPNDERIKPEPGKIEIEVSPAALRVLRPERFPR